MKHMNNILNDLDEIEIRTEEGWDFLTWNADETDGFDSRLDAEQHLKALQETARSLEDLVYWEKNGYLAMIDDYGTRVHAWDIKMDIEGQLWIDGETDCISFVAVSSHDAIVDFTSATDCFFNNCLGAEDILPVNSQLASNCKWSYVTELFLQYDDKECELVPMESYFLTRAIRKELNLKR